jgi:hypothetical protein
MKSKDKIKLKIQALLAKNTENGASEAEAKNALSKAQELMKTYFISESELQDPFLGESCLLKSVDIIKSGYTTDMFYAHLSNLFDCEHYYTKSKIYFFGFEQDADLCIYFYSLIVKSCLRAKSEYLKSADYKELKRHYTGRSLAASFIKGFQWSLCGKMDELYQARQEEIGRNTAHGIVLVKKKTKVTEAYDLLGVDVKRSRQRTHEIERTAFDQGQAKGEDFHLTQGVGTNKAPTTPKLMSRN